MLHAYKIKFMIDKVQYNFKEKYSNKFEDFLKKNYRWMTKIVAGYIKACYYFVEDFLLDSTWLLIAAIIFLPCLIAGGLRLGLYSLFVVYFWGATKMWEPSGHLM